MIEIADAGSRLAFVIAIIEHGGGLILALFARPELLCARAYSKTDGGDCRACFFRFQLTPKTLSCLSNLFDIRTFPVSKCFYIPIISRPAAIVHRLAVSHRAFAVAESVRSGKLILQIRAPKKEGIGRAQSAQFIAAFVLRQGTKNPAREKPQAGFVALDTPLKRGTQIILFFQISPSRS